MMVDETGYKQAGSLYTCKKCQKKADLQTATRSGWVYKINAKEKDLVYLTKKKTGYIPESEVDYLCPQDYKKLPGSKKKTFIELGLPYFICTIKENGGIYSF